MRTRKLRAWFNAVLFAGESRRPLTAALSVIRSAGAHEKYAKLASLDPN